MAVTVPGDVEQGRSEVTNVLHKTADTKVGCPRRKATLQPRQTHTMTVSDAASLAPFGLQERQASGSAAARAAATKEEDDDVTLLEDIEDGNGACHGGTGRGGSVHHEGGRRLLLYLRSHLPELTTSIAPVLMPYTGQMCSEDASRRHGGLQAGRRRPDQSIS